jgi:hypothetical protein
MIPSYSATVPALPFSVRADLHILRLRREGPDLCFVSPDLFEELRGPVGGAGAMDADELPFQNGHLGLAVMELFEHRLLLPLQQIHPPGGHPVAQRQRRRADDEQGNDEGDDLELYPQESEEEERKEKCAEQKRSRTDPFHGSMHQVQGSSHSEGED